MKTEIKSFAVMGGAGYLAARYVFEATPRKAILYGVLAGTAIVALLQLKVKLPGITPPVVDKANSPVSHPEVDNSGVTNTPENLPPINFQAGGKLEDSVDSQLSSEAVTDWDVAWGDNPYKQQYKTINV